MILIEYSKLNGGQFIPHLDMLKHLTKIFRRMGVNVKYSQGFNPHILIYMSSPIALGLKSLSEFCLVDTDDNIKDFKEKFNLASPKGIKCENVFETYGKVKVASDITSALYEIRGLNKFDVNEVLNAETFTIIDKKGELKEVKDKILSLYFEGDVLYAKLKFGNDTLRPDYLSNRLAEIYGGEHIDILKKSVEFLDGLKVFEYLERLKCQ